MFEQLHYIDKKYQPGKNDLVAEYYLEPNKASFEKAAENIALESSIGTWTSISTMNVEIARSLKPHVFFIDKKSKIIKIAYPEDLFEPGNMPQILSSVAGNIFGMKILKNLKLLDIHFSKRIVNSFKGPRFGIEGVRKLVNTKRPLTATKVSRPLVGTIVKPKLGLNELQHANVAYQAWLGGLDLVKDDENLTSMSFNKFQKRIALTLKMRDKAEKETGEKKLYMPNITAETEEMKKRADYVKSCGGEYIMVDILTSGWSALQTIRNYNKSMFIHAHRAMHAALTKNPKHGISMLTLAKIARLIGVDQLHVGTANVGKMSTGLLEDEIIAEDIEEIRVKEKDKYHVLEQDWYGVKPVMAVCSGGLHPGSLPELVKKMGHNIIAQFGGGCHGHPDGTFTGAVAIRQALDATMQKIPLKKYAENHSALRKALEKWN